MDGWMDGTTTHFQKNPMVGMWAGQPGSLAGPIAHLQKYCLTLTTDMANGSVSVPATAHFQQVPAVITLSVFLMFAGAQQQRQTLGVGDSCVGMFLGVITGTGKHQEDCQCYH